MQTQLHSHSLEHQEDPIDFISETKIHDRRQIDAAIIFEKALSCILARNFIECWDQLKLNYYENNRFVIKQSIKYRQDNGLTLDQIEKKSHSRKRYHSNTNRYTQERSRAKQVSHERYADDSIMIRRNKSIRVISAETEQSRANILREIVDKLKAHKEAVDNEDEDNAEVYRKISKLEALIRSIKLEQSREQQSENYLKQEMKKYQRRNQNNAQRNNSDEEQEKLLEQFMSEVLEIRKQIAIMKQNNEHLLQIEFQRSQASQARQNKELSNPKIVNYHEKFENEVLQHDNHIEGELKVLENKVDLILKQVKQGKVHFKKDEHPTDNIHYSHYEHHTQIGNLDRRKESQSNFRDNSQQTQDKYRDKIQEQMKKAPRNPELQIQNQTLKKLQENMAELLTKIQNNRIQIENQKLKEKNSEKSISILPLTHKNSGPFNHTPKEQTVPSYQKEQQTRKNYDFSSSYLPKTFGQQNTQKYESYSSFKNQTNDHFFNNHPSPKFDSYKHRNQTDFSLNNYEIGKNKYQPGNLPYQKPPFSPNFQESHRSNSDAFKTTYNQTDYTHRPFLSHHPIQYSGLNLPKNISPRINFNGSAANLGNLSNGYKFQTNLNQTSSYSPIGTNFSMGYRPPAQDNYQRGKNFCSQCGRNCDCLPIAGFIRKY